jgi:hypothetical protein
VYAYVRVVFSVFILIFSMWVSFIFIMNKVTTLFLPLVKLQSLCHDDIWL